MYKKKNEFCSVDCSLMRRNSCILFLATAILAVFLPQGLLYAQDPRVLPETGKSDIEKTLEEKRELEKRVERKQKRQLKMEIDQARRTFSGGGYAVGYQVTDGDTIFLDRLPPVFKFDRMKGNRSGRSWRKYRRLVYNFKKVYPYALQAKDIIHEADSVLANSDFSAHQREKYISQYQKQLFSQFEKPLRKMTISQGKLLMKLIDRELGRTSFYIIKEYRGRLAAGFWQTVARVFGNDLKKPYDRFGEDRMVEDLILIYNSGAFDYLYYSMFNE